MSKMYQFGNWWCDEDFINNYKEYRIKFARRLLGLDPVSEVKYNYKETFYYVNLANSDDSIHTLGMKSRKTGKIFLTKEYEVDLNTPIEDTDFHYVRDSRPMDI